ncbi:hypothetical protein [Dyadobacter sp. CY347]|uniref:hypothetical protein n=1 Tax=Dyadobacter sp. CY347 TaxID=2909336 RepID=UPI001F439A66|nr:hypothetical protein [Dyadobacter sp. CY347]MCF2488058.1 hypothetical protein [Dyadobacter sp. CY347]
MKLVHRFVLMLILISQGCRQEPDLLEDGCIGASFFYLDNQSSESLLVDFDGPMLNDQIDTAALVDPGKRTLIGQGASFGSIPTPMQTFIGFELYKLSDGKKTLVYKQDPLEDTLWIKRKHNPDDPDFGCQQADYILKVTQDMLK